MSLLSFLLWLVVFELQLVINHGYMGTKKLQFAAYEQFVLVLIKLLKKTKKGALFVF